MASQLRTIRRRLAGWLWVEGLSRLLLLTLGLFCIDLAVDWGFRLDRSQRVIMLGLMVAAWGAGIWYWLVRPLRVRLSDEALILQLEQHHAGTRGDLISAWQFAQRDNWEAQGVSASLVEATIRLGVQSAEQVNLDELFHRERHRRNQVLLALGGGLLAVWLIAALTHPVFQIWLNRNLLLGDAQWWQDTYLVVEGLDDEGRLPLVRGEDGQLVVTVDPQSQNQDVEVFFDYRDSGSRYRQKMRRADEAGQPRFTHTFGTVVSEFRFQVFGGDDRSDWIQVRLVEPPSFNELELTAIPPAYTGLPPQPLERGRSPYQVLAGSRFRLEGVANKPLASARLSSPEQDFELVEHDGRWSLLLEPAELVEGKYRLDLTDAQGLATKNPPTFVIRLEPDRAPRVRANTVGVSGLVVPRARIPLRINMEDDFAITGSRLAFQWKADTPDSIPQEGQVAFPTIEPLLGEPAIDFATTWELESENVPIGAGLTFRVLATDNQAGEPNTGESKTFLLRVVSEAELRTDLLRREREQREDLERQITLQDDLLTETRALQAEVGRSDLPAEERTLDPVNVVLNQRKQQRSLAAVLSRIADRMEDLLIEAENNRLDEESGRLRNRLLQGVIEPLRSLDQNELAALDRQLDAARLAVSQESSLPPLLETIAEQQQTVRQQLETILASMVKAEGYQEAVNLLKEIERSQQDVLEMTEEQRQKRIQSIFEGDASGDNRNDQD